jgi:hypothetical protein
MSAVGHHPPVPAQSPDLSFAVLAGRTVAPAAVPTLEFEIALEAEEEWAIRSVLLNVQIQIAARKRPYAPAEQPGLLDLFGTPERWGTTLHTLPWLRTTAVVPPFRGRTSIALPVPCTYDLEVTSARYFAALRRGEIPLEFLFSGSVFYTGPSGALQTTRIGWDCEAELRLPVPVWREMMEHHFADTAWLRLRADTLECLSTYRGERALLSWDAVIADLLERRP